MTPTLTVREANRRLLTGQPVVGITADGGRTMRVTRVHIRQGTLEGKEINTGRWTRLVDIRPAP